MGKHNPVRGFQVDRASLGFVGSDLQRPECILAERDGSLWAADARGGVVHLMPDGRQRIISQHEQTAFAAAGSETERYTVGTLPNGLAFARNGDLVIANFGTDRLELMTRDGRTRVLHDTIDGQAIGKTNFVLRDSKDRLWLTVSTRIRNWMDAFSPDIADGYIALVDEHGIRIVADGFAFTNEIRFDAAEEWLYVVETTGQRVSRLRVQPDGSLTEREIFGPRKLGASGFPDGIAFDAFGNLWGTLIMSDILFVLTPEGDYLEVLVDGDPATSATLEAAFHAGQVSPDTLLATGGQLANWFASVTFGGQDLQTCYIGSLRGTRIPFFRAPVAGLPMVHWHDR